MSEIERRKIDFSVFLLHRLSDRFERPAAHLYRELEPAKVFEGYVIPYYDVLHTLGEEYLVEDVIAYARNRGVML
ncbi:DUF3791 domain-containing protein [Xiamenia xianingshaonis]|uniref:DUF3791 domain-containing protein n=1 Tax=Xiamenia xianingshaonis TaxID=2682776 RepID=UPI001409743B|nr:DUF3791 domain-containing protein [Xiamenia xianingshaonis]